MSHQDIYCIVQPNNFRIGYTSKEMAEYQKELIYKDSKPLIETVRLELGDDETPLPVEGTPDGPFRFKPSYIIYEKNNKIPDRIVLTESEAKRYTSEFRNTYHTEFLLYFPCSLVIS